MVAGSYKQRICIATAAPSTKLAAAGATLLLYV